MRLDVPFRGSEAVAASLVTWRQLRGPRFRRLHHDVHVLAEVPADLEQAVRAAQVRLPGAVAVGRTAAALHGALDTELVEDPGPVEVALVGGARPVEGLTVRRERLRPEEVTEHDGLAVTTPVRTALDVARRLGTVDAVVVVEALVRDHGVTVAAIRELAGEHPRARGLRRLWIALEHVDEGSGIALDSRVRLALVVEGLPRPEVGHVARDPRTGLAYGSLDLAWPAWRCGLLCERDEDTAREMAGRLVADGWTVQRVDQERWRTERERVVENAGHLVRVCRRRVHAPEDENARIIASWPSRARRRPPVPVRLLS